jgi:hypothetical protein
MQVSQVKLKALSPIELGWNCMNPLARYFGKQPFGIGIRQQGILF